MTTTDSRRMGTACLQATYLLLKPSTWVSIASRQTRVSQTADDPFLFPGQTRSHASKLVLGTEIPTKAPRERHFGAAVPSGD